MEKQRDPSPAISDIGSLGRESLFRFKRTGFSRDECPATIQNQYDEKPRQITGARGHSGVHPVARPADYFDAIRGKNVFRRVLDRKPFTSTDDNSSKEFAVKFSNDRAATLTTGAASIDFCHNCLSDQERRRADRAKRWQADCEQKKRFRIASRFQVFDHTKIKKGGFTFFGRIHGVAFFITIGRTDPPD